MSPEACKKQAIPYRQAHGLKRICSSVNKSDHRIEEFKDYLHKKGLKKNTQCEKVKSKDRKELLFQNKEKSVNNNVVPLVLNFYPALSGLSQKVNVKPLWPVLHAHCCMLWILETEF